MSAGTAPIPRSVLAVGIDHSLRGSLAQRAAGRDLVIDGSRSWQCGTWVGDLTVEWWRREPGDDYVALEPLEGVRLFAHRRLLGLLRLAGPTLVRSRLPILGGLAVTLERPELWIDFLDRPTAFRDESPAWTESSRD